MSIRLLETIMRVESKTSDNVFVMMEVAIQHRIIPDQVFNAFYKLDNAPMQISSYVFNSIRAAVPLLTLDDVFVQQETIANTVRDELTKEMSNFGYFIEKTLITDITPNARVKDSMNEINAAVRARLAAREKAETEKINLVKQAEAEAESKYLQGRGTARQRKAIVDGLRDSVSSFEGMSNIEPRHVIQIMLLTQYCDTLKEIGSNSRAKTVFLSTSPNGPDNFMSEIRSGFMQAAAAKI